MRLDDLYETELDMSDDARMARAKALGFTVTAFHGTKAKFNEFDVEKGKPSIMGGYAPHFADSHGEADGYRKEAGRGAKVLHCLLRVRKPLVISFQPNTGKITPAEFKRITGHAWDGTDPRFPPSGRKALDKLMDTFGWSDHRANYVGMRAPSFLAWEAPHPWAPATRNTFGIVNCVWTEHLTLAVEFAEQFGRAVYINHPPYVPDLTGVPQTRLFGPKHER